MRFQPIVDTSGHRVLGHECLSESVDSGADSVAELAPTSRGLYFITAPPGPLIVHPEFRDRFVFQIGDQAPGVIDVARASGAQVALCTAGTTPGYLELICNVRPDFVKLDPFLTRNVEQPASAAAIRRIVELGDRFGSKVIAAGVNRPRILEDLWLLGVEIMQGELFGVPAFQAVQMTLDLGNLSSVLG